MGNKLCGLGSLRRRSSKCKRKTSNNHSSPTESTQNVVHSDPQPSESASTQSEVQPDSQPTESEAYNVWYRHTGEDLPSDDWWSYSCSSYTNRTAQQILEDVGEHDITHLCIDGKLPPSLKAIAPNLVHLQIFALRDSQHESLSELNGLKVLHLWNNDFSSRLPSVIGELKSLTELHMQSCKLTDLPDDMSELKLLKILNLAGNDFSSGLPEIITKLTSLTKLSLMSCRLPRLPERFGELEKLEQLNLGCDKSFSESLTDLPPSMSELKQLERLELDGNDFSKGLPEVITELSSLRVLSLMGCQLTILPPRFDKLQRLEALRLEDNNFSSGIPDVITKLRSLVELYLLNCSLTDLPLSLVNLERLRELNLQGNKLKRIPSVIYKFKELEHLDVRDNCELVKMDKKILQLNKLQKIGLRDVALQGLEIIKKYFVDLEKKAAVTTIPIAIIGEAGAGKTSIRMSLISQKREPIDWPSPAKNATPVFDTLVLETSETNLIDFSSQDMYHRYQLVLNETCAPLVVVNMERYNELIEAAQGEEETKRHFKEEQATKRLCMEWLCHLYVAQPTLGRPMLALTHIDKLPSRENFEKLKGTLLQKAEEIQKKWLRRETRFSDSAPESDSNSERISCIKKIKFVAEDIFEFTNETESSNIEALRTRIESRCVGEIPQNWKDVEDQLKNFSGPYIKLSDVTTKSPDFRDILRYLHNTGAILWFDQKEELENYVFHDTQAVTNMVALLFPLDKDKMKAECIEAFSGSFHKGKEIGIREYEQFLENYLYKTAGMIDEALLYNLVNTQTKFKFSIAKDLLLCFRIIHGPIQLEDDSSPRTVYLVPSFITKSLDKPWETPDQLKLQLRLDLIFNGLPLPEHIYQLMTVVVLNLKWRDEHVEVYSNGAEVQHGEDSTTYLVQDYDNQKVTVLVSTNVKSLQSSWYRLKSATKDLKSWFNEKWPACLVELETYCAHCLFLRDPAPGSLANPAWYTTGTTSLGLKPRKCLKSNSKDLVPTAFLMPCCRHDESEIEKLEGYLTKWQPEAFDTH